MLDADAPTFHQQLLGSKTTFSLVEAYVRLSHKSNRWYRSVAQHLYSCDPQQCNPLHHSQLVAVCCTWIDTTLLTAVASSIFLLERTHFSTRAHYQVVELVTKPQVRSRVAPRPVLPPDAAGVCENFVSRRSSPAVKNHSASVRGLAWIEL